MAALAARLLLPTALLFAALQAACGAPDAPRPSADVQTWRGPRVDVTSRGLITYDRREIAQKVTFPACIMVGAAAFRYRGVRPLASGAPVPPGLYDTGLSLDQWRLLARAGALDDQVEVYVTVRGSTGILGEYPRLSEGQGC
ncbi:MAG: hypothetical protein U0531_07955 [Dehalococcoidia bacterium]